MKLLSVLLLLMIGVGCSGYGAGNGMQAASTPSVAKLAPDSANAGGEEFMLTVTGTGFASNSVIYWNSATVTTTFVSAQELTASIPAADITTAGTASVYVKNPGTGIYVTGVNSNMVSFTIN